MMARGAKDARRFQAHGPQVRPVGRIDHDILQLAMASSWLTDAGSSRRCPGCSAALSGASAMASMRMRSTVSGVRSSWATVGGHVALGRGKPLSSARGLVLRPG